MEKTIADVKAKKAEREANAVYQFPIWRDPERGFPNELIRSALFGAIQAKDRTYLDNVEIRCQDGHRIVFTGQRLDQTHADVFEGVMHMARGIAEGNSIRFSAHSLLKLIGRSTGKSDHQWLFRTFQQLTATSVAIFDKSGEKVFWGSLLPSGAGDVKQGGYSIDMPRHLIKLFDRGFTVLDFESRKLLRRKPLCQWLHAYYSSHAKPYPVFVETLRDMSGSKATVKRFKANLKVALDALKDLGFILDWQIDANNKVFVARKPTPSQQRFLDGQAATGIEGP